MPWVSVHSRFSHPCPLIFWQFHSNIHHMLHDLDIDLTIDMIISDSSLPIHVTRLKGSSLAAVGAPAFHLLRLLLVSD